jgi:vanillate O-demethylase monooxygenase subunit
MFIRNAWYAAALSGDIKPEPFPRTILNEKIVMYRTSTNQIVALRDRCAHRQVPLSRGKLVGDEIQCWYHGLRYSTTGKCVAIPSQNAIPHGACVRAFPAVEKYGLIWLWMGEQVDADESKIPNHWVCSSPELAGQLSYCAVNCNYLFGIDNILDISHAAFVHTKTLGSLEVAETPPEVIIDDNRVCVRRFLTNEKTPPLYTNILKLDFMDRLQDVIYWPVGNTRVETTAHPHGNPNANGLRVYTTTIFTPATDMSSHIFVGMHRDFDIGNQGLTDIITASVFSTVLEDKDVAESLQGNWDPTAPMIEIKLDRPAIAARRMLERLGEPAHPYTGSLRRHRSLAPILTEPASGGQ